MRGTGCGVRRWALVALLGACLTGAAWAQDEGAGAGAEPAAAAVAAPEAAPAAAPAANQPADTGGSKAKIPESILELIYASGGIGWLICALSVVALAMIIECFSNIKAEKTVPMEVLTQVEELLDAGEYEQAMEVCTAHDCMMTRVINAGLNKMGAGYERMAEAMADEGESQATALHQKIGWINLLSVVSPALGLLGTVQGMIGSFQVIAKTTSPQASDLATGIFVALLTTFEGLCVSIPCSVAFVYFRGRVVRITGAMSTIVSEVLDRFRPIHDAQQ